MSKNDWLATQFAANRAHLRRVATRMLGSASEAEDAVQEAWLKLIRAELDAVENLGGWLTTVVARVCLDALRSRKSRREEPLGVDIDGHTDDGELGLADAIGPALLVVLDMLAPAERVAFVLHDMFDLSFDEIGPIVNRTPTAARQLASRARRRVRGKALPEADLAAHHEVVGAFLAASRDGDFQRLVAVLSPDAVLRADALAVHMAASNQQQGAPSLSAESRGAAAVADAFRGRARAALPATIDGEAGSVWVGGGQVRAAFLFAITDGKITAVEVVMEPTHLAELTVEMV